MMFTLLPTPLAQLSDILSTEGWYIFFAAGSLAPGVGLAVACWRRTAVWWHRDCVLVFYLLLIGTIVFMPGAGVLGGCVVLVLMPIGAILGAAVIVRTGAKREVRGFEVESKADRDRE